MFRFLQLIIIKNSLYRFIYSLGIAGVHDLQLDQITCNDFIPLSDPIQIFRFDYTGESSINKTGDTKMNFLAKNNGK